MANNNIILIGMPACGKSTVGVILAKALKKGFCDTDLLIQQSADEELYKIIEENGLEYFIALENSTVAGLELSNTVIATGGSVVYGKDAMKRLCELGTVIYLRLPLTEIEKRIGNITTRGVVMPSGSTLKDEYAQRTPLYERYASLTVDCEGKTPEQVVTEIYHLQKDKSRQS